MKIKAKIKNSQLDVKVKLSSDNQVNDIFLSAFSGVYLRGFLKPERKKDKLIEYTGPMGAPLSDIFKKSIGKRDFLLILEQIADSYIRLSNSNLSPDFVLWNLDNVFFNNTTKELQLIYFPTNNKTSVGEVYQFIESIINSAKPVEDGERDYITRFKCFFYSQISFNAEVIENYIAKEDRSVVNSIKSNTKNRTQFITDKQKDYFEHQEEKKQKNIYTVDNNYFNDYEGSRILTYKIGYNHSTGVIADEETGMLPNDNIPANNNLQYRGSSEASGVKQNHIGQGEFLSYNRNPSKFNTEDEATGLLNENTMNYFGEYSHPYAKMSVTNSHPYRSNSEENCDAQSGCSNDWYDGTGILSDYGKDCNSGSVKQFAERSNNRFCGQQCEDTDISTGLLNEYTTGYNKTSQPMNGQTELQNSGIQSCKQNNSFSPYSEGVNNYVNDGLLVHNNETGLLIENDCNTQNFFDSQISYPTLIRVITNEKILINKPVFRLGKERSYVDYFVNNNAAISRSHADIVTRGSHYFVVDLNSKNRTFINNRVIPAHYETEIFNGDKLKLGNEEFIFNT